MNIKFSRIFFASILCLLCCFLASTLFAQTPSINHEHYAQSLDEIEAVFVNLKKNLGEIHQSKKGAAEHSLSKTPVFAQSIEEIDQAMTSLKQTLPEEKDDARKNELLIKQAKTLEAFNADSSTEYFMTYKTTEEVIADEPVDREKIIERTLDETAFKIKLGYMFVKGEQSFRLRHPSFYGDLSKLTYPMKGGMGFISAEAKLTPRFFIGGRYAASNFKKTTSKDEDWNIPLGEFLANYHLTEHDTKNNVHFYNVNLYHRLYDLDRQDLGGESALKSFFVDKLHIDGFVGYQHYRGRHNKVDPITKWEFLIGEDWYKVPTPAYEGLDSWYKVTYQGPRLGLRVGGEHTKRFSSALSFSYAWLRTKADAYWNLRDFTWHHKGKGFGSSINLDFEVEYRLTPRWFIGAGVHSMWQRHRKSLYSGTQPGGSFHNLDLPRDTQMDLFGYSFQAGYRW